MYCAGSRFDSASVCPVQSLRWAVVYVCLVYEKSEVGDVMDMPTK